MREAVINKHVFIQQTLPGTRELLVWNASKSSGELTKLVFEDGQGKRDPEG